MFLREGEYLLHHSMRILGPPVAFFMLHIPQAIEQALAIPTEVTPILHCVAAYIEFGRVMILTDRVFANRSSVLIGYQRDTVQRTTHMTAATDMIAMELAVAFHNLRYATYQHRSALQQDPIHSMLTLWSPVVPSIYYLLPSGIALSITAPPQNVIDARSTLRRSAKTRLYPIWHLEDTGVHCSRPATAYP